MSQTLPPDARSWKLITCPFEVRLDGVLRDQFYDVRDAIAFARIVKQKNSTSVVTIVDMTGRLVLEVES